MSVQKTKKNRALQNTQIIKKYTYNKPKILLTMRTMIEWINKQFKFKKQTQN